MCGDRAFLCSICFQSIDLSQSKTDENGRPVHESCYTDRLRHMSARKPVVEDWGWRRLGERLARMVARR